MLAFAGGCPARLTQHLMIDCHYSTQVHGADCCCSKTAHILARGQYSARHHDRDGAM